jgi:gentisate 1,2-dioxygenase
LARNGPPHPAHGIKMRYANPLNGGYAFPTIAVFIQWLPKAFAGQAYRSTDGTVFNVVEGSGRIAFDDSSIAFAPHDVFVVPPWTSYRLTTDSECVLFSYSDRAAQETLGFWREEDPPRA